MGTIILMIIFAGIAWLIFKLNSEPEGSHSESASTATPDLSFLPERFVVFDLETTGLNPDRHHIIEVGAIRVNRDTDTHETFSSLVKPRGRITSRITELTKLDRDTLEAEGLAIEEVLVEFRSFVGDLPLVAFNAEFDHGLLLAECERTGVPAFPNKVFCALKLARSAWPDRQSYRLTNICTDAGIQVTAEHRALPDCERALRVYVAAAQKLRRDSL